MDRHFTASCYVIQDDKCLLLYHPKFQMWLQPGGHVEKNETPPEAIKREVREETGLEINLIRQENLWIDRWNAKSFERPYLCAVEEVDPEHFHIDMIYIAKPCGGILIESDKLRWFTLEETQNLITDVEVFGETQQIVEQILETAPVS